MINTELISKRFLFFLSFFLSNMYIIGYSKEVK